METGETSVAHSEFISADPAPMEVPQVTWWKHRGLRKLYPMMPILFLGSTINGYDGSLLNGLQTMTPWQDCEHKQTLRDLHADIGEDFNNPSGSTLGLFTAIQNIGGICSLFFCMLLSRTVSLLKKHPDHLTT